MRRVVLTRAAALVEAGGTARDTHVDSNRLRRMDRFGRSGFLTGARVLAAAGRTPAAAPDGPDPRFGVVVGTACGCRDAITQHERLLASAARVEDLAPSVFVATVHNAVCGEIAILYGLGGVAETLVSGRTAGLEALVLAARRVAAGDADRILVVGAEGLDEETRRAFLRENPESALVESAAAVLVEAEEEKEEEEISSSKRKRVVFVDAALTFGDPPEAAGFEERPEDFSEGVGGGVARGEGGAVMERLGAPGIERLGATGLWEIAEDLSELAAARPAVPGDAPAEGAPPPRSPSKRIRTRRYTVHDAHGSCCSVTLEFSS